MTKFLVALVSFVLVAPASFAETPISEEVREAAQMLPTALRGTPSGFMLEVEKATASASAQVGFEGIREGAPSEGKESFFSLTNLALTAFQFGGAYYDADRTVAAFALAGDYDVVRDGVPMTVTIVVTEQSSFYRPAAFSMSKMLLLKAAVNVPIAVVSHFLRKSDNDFVRGLGWALPIVAGGLQFGAGVQNQKEINWIHSRIR